MDNFTTLPEENKEEPLELKEGVSKKLLLPKIPSIPQHLLKPVLSVVGILLIVGSVGTAFYFYSQYQNTQKLLKNPAQATNIQVQSVVKKVSTLMELPTNETPQVATVVDKTKLLDQPFFARSENGDAVLLYAKNREAILYRPKINKIIEVAPLNITNSPAKKEGSVAGVSIGKTAPSPTAKPTATPTPQKQKLKVAIYNGTTDAGVVSSVQREITQKYPSYTVVFGNTNVKGYGQTTVYSLKQRSAEAHDIAKLLNAEFVSTLPEGEIAPDADILVIVGK